VLGTFCAKRPRGGPRLSTSFSRYPQSGDHEQESPAPAQTGSVWRTIDGG
jgi:hypothetical protein